MKIIGQAALWLIDKFIYLLIGKKEFPPTFVPDDWPPDGSMHFLRFDHPIGSTGLPPNAVQYEFAANVGEDDPLVFSLGQEIISRLCDSRKTLIVFSFDPVLSNYERKKATAPHSETVAQSWHTSFPHWVLVIQRNSFQTIKHLQLCLTASSMYICFPRKPCRFIQRKDFHWSKTANIKPTFIWITVPTH